MTATPPQDEVELQRDTAPGSAQKDAVGDGAEGELSDHHSAVLHRLLRVAYPHPSFPDGPYARTAAAILATDGSADLVAAGLADLDGRAGGDFGSLEDDAATQVVEQIADTPFFALVHSTTVVALYDDHEVWDLLGYEGSSFDKGGYLHRGFDDLDWLPTPRIEEYSGEPRVELVAAPGNAPTATSAAAQGD
ncbi:MAG: hypothetical protein WKF57_15595 [Nakamurella sp.]